MKVSRVQNNTEPIVPLKLSHTVWNNTRVRKVMTELSIWVNYPSLDSLGKANRDWIGGSIFHILCMSLSLWLIPAYCFKTARGNFSACCHQTLQYRLLLSPPSVRRNIIHFLLTLGFSEVTA